MEEEREDEGKFTRDNRLATPVGDIRPARGKILVKVDKTADKTPGGLVIPDCARAHAHEAEVISTGEDRIDEKGRAVRMAVKAGDRVLLTMYAGFPFREGEQDYLIVLQEDVIALVAP